MQIRDNIRRRRQERIVQLLGRRPDDLPIGDRGEPAEPPIAAPAPLPFSPPAPKPPAPPIAPTTSTVHSTDTDPELWWKEQQKRLGRAQPNWQGAGSLAAAPAHPSEPPDHRSPLSRFAAGLAVRAVIAAVLFGAAWLWFPSDLPGSQAARGWAAVAVTRDMDFQAIEAWYGDHFGGSPSFLPVFRSNKGEAQAVSGEWKRSEAVPPAAGKVVQTFKQDATGIRIAAQAGSEVHAVYAGRIISVDLDDDGRATIQIRHAGQIVTQYGNVSQPAVRADDWVLAGQRLGAVPAPIDKGGESLLYFAVKRNDQAVDPAEVVPID